MTLILALSLWQSFYVFQIHTNSYIAFFPPPLLLNQMAFFGFLANKYSLFDFALNLVSAYCQTSDFQHKHWRCWCWCWAIYFQFKLFFYCCFSIHLLLLMSFPYILMCETVACQRYLHLHLVCQWEGEWEKKNQHKHNQSKHSDYSSGTAKYEKYNRMIIITTRNRSGNLWLSVRIQIWMMVRLFSFLPKLSLGSFNSTSRAKDISKQQI